MAIDCIVDKRDTWGIWKDKHNGLCLNVGDLDLLTTPSTSDIVTAINSLVVTSQNTNRRVVILGIALN